MHFLTRQDCQQGKYVCSNSQTKNDCNRRFLLFMLCWSKVFPESVVQGKIIPMQAHFDMLKIDKL